MRQIVKVHYPRYQGTVTDHGTDAIYEIREQQGLKRNLQHPKFGLAKVVVGRGSDARRSETGRRNLLPKLHGALLKNEQDVQLFERLAFMSRR